MKHIYLLLLLLFPLMLFSQQIEATNIKPATDFKAGQAEISGLYLYPNPATEGYINIYTKNERPKKILIYNLLGRQILTEVIRGSRLDISHLSPGVYIIRIIEEKYSTTRKLVVK